jgi:molybdate transport system ATP-binding protein
MIDIAIQLSVTDGKRSFAVDAAFATGAPVVALYGPSGAGKSLTLQAMAGLLTPTAGHVRIGKRTLFDAARGINLAPQARGVGYLFQDYALFPHLSVRQNIAFGLTNWRTRLASSDGQRVDALMESFGLTAMAHSKPATLSGGQQQRAALARALACNPQVLLLDEPFAALNPMLRAQLRAELAAVRARWGVPVVMITHDVEDVLALANVAFLFDHGRVVREVNLDTVQSRDAMRAAMQSEAPEPRPHAAQLRAMLSEFDRS